MSIIHAPSRSFAGPLAGRVAAALALVAAIAAGCSSSSSKRAHLTVTVQLDSALDIDQVIVKLSASGKSELAQGFPTAGAAPVTWSVDVAGLSAATTVTIAAWGNKAGVTKITAITTVSLSPGGSALATLRFDAACVDVTCGPADTCVATGAVGTCVPIPQMDGTDAGTGPDVATGSGGNTGGAAGGAAGIAGSAGSGGNGGASPGGMTGSGGLAETTAPGGNRGGGTGGQVASGGVIGTGGILATGGVTGTGGIIAASGGTLSTGGIMGTGGITGTGGMLACASGSHMCTAGCAMNTSIDSCGATSCATCPSPANGNATCDGTSCAGACNTNYHACGASCASNTDPMACGGGCMTCPVSPIPNSAPTCNGACGIGCATGYRACTNTSGMASCNRVSYDFNDGSVQGWTAAPNGPSAVTVLTSTSVRRGSTGASLQVGSSFGVFGSGSSMGTQVPLCANGSENLNGRTVSAWVYIDSNLPDCSPSTNQLTLVVSSAASANGMQVAFATPVVQTWFQITGTVTDPSVINAETVGLFLTLDCTNNAVWPIVMYVDDVTIGG